MVEGKYIAIAIVVVIVVIFSLLGVTGVFGNIVVAGGDPNAQPCNLPGAVCAFGEAIGFPSGWLRTDTFIWYSLIPILGIGMIVFGFLDRIQIFRGGINGILAFLIAFSMVPLGLFVLIVSFIFGIMGIYSVALFVGLFIAGTYLFSGGLLSSWRAVYGAYDRAIAKQENLKGKFQGELNKVNALLGHARATPPTGPYHGMGAALVAEEIQDLSAKKIKIEKEKKACDARVAYLKSQRTSGKRVAQAMQET